MGKSQTAAVLNLDAAAYVRMSTEHQQYSTANQLDVIQEFARTRGLIIKIVYSDEGKSGLSILGRDALARLISDVDSGDAKFGHILVYDVSRWGRFQDADESAYYEYACRRAGISVHYCAEQFDNDGSPLSTIIKSIKRAMAGEFSRELSTKVFQGQCRLVQLGFRQGGKPGYGFRRMLVGENGVRKGILSRGEHKCIHTDHVILVPGPDAEQKTVRWIFRQFVEKRHTEAEIATALNAKGIFNHDGRRWSGTAIHDLLLNEKYIGHNVYHRHSWKLKKKHVTNPPNMWVRAENVFEGIVPKKLFEAAHEIFRRRNETLTENEVLDQLRKILTRHGKITGVLIKRSSKQPLMSGIRRHFGTLKSAYSAVGYRPPHDYSYKDTLPKLRSVAEAIIVEVRKHAESIGCTAREDHSSKFLIINEEIRLFVYPCRHYTTGTGASRWMISLYQRERPELILAARMHPHDQSIRDYYLLPVTEIKGKRLWLAEENGIDLDGYRFDSLENLCGVFEQVALFAT